MENGKKLSLQINNSKQIKDNSMEVVGSISTASSNDSDKSVSTALTEAFYNSVVKINDGSFNNRVLNLGLSDPGLSSAEFSTNMITFDRMTITDFYHGSWVFRRVIDKVAQDMWRAGITINGDTDPEGLKKIYKRLSRLRTELIWATEQARLYGGAATLIMVDDGEVDLTKPLNLNKIKPGAKIRLFTVDRWYGLEQSTERVTNISNPDFGLPKYYSFYLDFSTEGGTGSTTITAHHSRVLRWENRRSVRLINQRLLGWGISELEHIYQDLQAYENSKGSSASLVGKALLEIVKLSGLRGAMTGLAMGNGTEQSQLTGQLTALNNFRTNNLILLDSEDEYHQESFSFSGLSDILEVWKDIIAGAAEMPKVLLYGDTKGGLTSDSPAEMEFYAGTINGKQEEMIRRSLDKLLPIIYKCEGVEIPKDIDYDFESVAETSQSKKLDLVNNVIDNVTKCMDSGLMTHTTALKEIKQVQKITGFGTNISEEDEQLATRMDKEEEQMPNDSESFGDESEENLETDDYTEEIKQVEDTLKTKRKFFDRFKK